VKRILTLTVAILIAVLLGTVAATITADATERKVKTWGTRTIYVQESLPRGYDVHRAIEAWDNRSRLNLILVKRCPPGKACIRFTAGRRPGHAVATTWAWQTSKRIVKCDVIVDTRKLSNLSAKRRLASLAHETGHCLGFKHDHSRRNLMSGVNTSARSWKPSAAHYRALQRTYGR